MISADKTLDYFADALSMGLGLAWQEEHVGEAWTLRIDELSSGVLDARTAQGVLAAYFDRHTSLVFGSTDVPVVISLRHLVTADDNMREPVLFVGARLDAHGYLHPRDDMSYWLARNHIRQEGVANDAITFCDMDTYRTYQYALSALEDEDFTALVRHATGMFDSVLDLDKDQLDQLGAYIEVTNPTLYIASEGDEGLAAAQRLTEISYLVSSSGLEAVTKPLRTLLLGASADPSPSLQMVAPDDAGQYPDPLRDAFPNDPLIAHKLFAGMPTGVYEANEQRRATVARLGIADQEDVHVLAVEAGYDRAGLSLAVAANRYLESALRGDEAPATAIMAKRDTIALMLDMLDARPAVSRASVSCRWIPRIATNASPQGQTAQQGRTLGPLNELSCVVDVGDWTWASDTRREAAFVLNPVYGQEGGVVDYQASWYLLEARRYFLDRVASFMGKTVNDLHEAIELLSERLRLIDQLRCELIDAQDAVCRASELLLERDDLTDRIANLRERHTALHDRLSYWEEMRDGGSAQSTIAGLAPQLEEAYIASVADPHEALAKDATSLNDVVEAYVGQILEVEADIQRAHERIQEIMYGTRLADEQGEYVTRTLMRLMTLCKFDASEAAELEGALDSGATSLEALEESLDRTVRSVEFWLAVHVHEGRWLDTQIAHGAPGVAHGGLRRADVLALTAFTPFVFVAQEAACLAFGPKGTSYAHGIEGEAHQGTRPVSYLLLPDANLLSVPHGAAILSYTEGAAVLGSDWGGCTEQPLGPVSDMVRAEKHLSRDEWKTLRDVCLIASGESRLFEALGAEARALQRPLAGHVPQASGYVLVPDSYWERRAQSKCNVAEAFAIARWLKRREADLFAAVRGSGKQSLALATPYREQARLLRLVLTEVLPDRTHDIQIVVLQDLNCGAWDRLLVSTVAAPHMLNSDFGGGVESLIRLAQQACMGSLVWFVSPSWRRSKDPSAASMLADTHNVGRLYALPHRRHSDPEKRPAEGGRVAFAAAEPLSIEEVVEEFLQRNELDKPIFGAQAMLKLMSAGLIRKHIVDGEHRGWVPTTSGREIGIVEQRDADGLVLCRFLPTALPAVSLALSLSD